MPYALVLGCSAFWYPQTMAVDAYDSQLTRVVIEKVGGPISQHIVSIVLVFLQAMIINRMAVQNKLALEITLLPGMFFILFMSFFPSYLGFSDFLVANTFILLSIATMMEFYQKTHLVSRIYFSGILLGVAILFVPQYLLLILFGIFGVIYFNALNIKNILQLIGGVVTVLLAYYQILFLYNFDVFHEIKLYKLSLNNIFSKAILMRADVLLVLVLVIFSILGFNSYGRKKSMASQKKIHLLYYMMLSSLIITLLTSDPKIGLVYLALIPTSILVSMSFLSIKNRTIAGLIHIILLGVIAAIHMKLIPGLSY